jgi:hypothetical protein
MQTPLRYKKWECGESFSQARSQDRLKTRWIGQLAVPQNPPVPTFTECHAEPLIQIGAIP